MAINHLHSSSDVCHRHVWHRYHARSCINSMADVALQTEMNSDIIFVITSLKWQKQIANYYNLLCFTV
jgi:hypothetical protein